MKINYFERAFFLSAIFVITGVSIYKKDSIIALISALSGISYTILAGKGRVLCYYFGIVGTVCYCYISYKNGFFGNLCLNGLYYLPTEIAGIFLWKKNLKKNGVEIIKTKLGKRKAFFYFLITACLSCLFSLTGWNIFDIFTVTFSILGQYLTLKRRYEQWYAWLIVNILSLIMWFLAYKQGSRCFATVLMWGVYLVLNLYFIHTWRKELKSR